MAEVGQHHDLCAVEGTAAHFAAASGRGNAGGGVLRRVGVLAAASPRASQNEQKNAAIHSCGIRAMDTFVKKKSAIKIVIEITTTVRVVLFPTPAVPPRVVIPK